MASSSSSTPAGRGRLPVARRDRRPALAALALLLVLTGALGSALVAFRSGSRTDVLTVRADVPFGHVMTTEDFGTARVAADGGALVDAEAVKDYVGLYARTNIPADSLLNGAMLSADPVMPDNGELVGVVLDLRRRPTVVPEVGDVVALYKVADTSGQIPELDNNRPVRARVAAVGRGSSADSRSISVLVDRGKASLVADAAAQGFLAISLLPPSAAPDIDWKQS